MYVAPLLMVYDTRSQGHEQGFSPGSGQLAFCYPNVTL